MTLVRFVVQVVIGLLSPASPLACWCLHCRRLSCRSSAILGLRRAFRANRRSFFNSNCIARLDRLAFSVRFDLNRELGRDGSGSRLNWTQWSLCLLLFLWFHTGSLVRLVGTKLPPDFHQGLVPQAFFMKPFLTSFGRAADQDLVRISGFVTFANSIDGLSFNMLARGHTPVIRANSPITRSRVYRRLASNTSLAGLHRRSRRSPGLPLLAV